MFASFSASVLKLCMILGIPGTIENPKSSRIWLYPSIVALSRCRHRVHTPSPLSRPSSIVLDFCQFGTDWRKPTKILGIHIDLNPIASTCTGKRGICSRTGVKHQVLEGRAPGGQYWTRLATMYPFQFAKRLAMCLDTAITHKDCAKLSMIIK
jgi:hypothetical protein